MYRAIVEIPEHFLIFLNMYRINLDQRYAIDMFQDMLHLCYMSYYLGDKVNEDGNSINIIENIICVLEYCMSTDPLIEKSNNDHETNSFYIDVFNAIDNFIYTITPTLHMLGFFASNRNNIRLGGRIFGNKMVILY